MNTMLLILLVVTFLAGMYYCAKMTSSKLTIEEGLTNMANPRCPDILVQKDKKYFLYNSKVARVPGVNPVEFDNLEDYVEFMDWQRSQGIRCPVLYLQTTYDAQGNSVYKVRPSPTDLHGGLPPALANQPMAPPSRPIPVPPNVDGNVIIKNMTGPNPTLLIDATRNDQPYNTNSVPAFDQTNFYQGSTTPLDQMNQEQENMLYSPDPMDPNWGGQAYTQKLVDTGYYAGNEVSIRV
jgi:hypothetical protein